MQFTMTLLTSLFSATAFALPATTPVTPGKPVTWAISHYTTGCSPGGCVYNFNIASYGDQTPFPAFSTSCEGTDVQNAFKACADSQIQANLKPTTEALTLFVERLYPVGDETLLYAGNVTFPTVALSQEQSAEMLAYPYGQIAN
jgi:hypothetical protein